MCAVARLPIETFVAPTRAPLFALKDITPRFAGVTVLDDVSLDLHAGEVHMPMGENGAGKSTLMKVPCGAYRSDSGSLDADGRPVTVSSAADARRLEVAVIFQEYSLVPHLDLDTRRMVAGLGIAQQQMVEIAKAFS